MYDMATKVYKAAHTGSGHYGKIVKVINTDSAGVGANALALHLGSTCIYKKTMAFNNSGITGYSISTSGDPQYLESWSCVLTPQSGYQVLPWNTKVLMAGVDITDTSYDKSTGTISISSVTGDIAIEAEAVMMSSEYEPIEYIYQRHQNATNVWQLPYPATHLTEIEIDSQFASSGVLVGHSGFGASGSGVLTTDFVFRPRYTAAHTGYASRWGTDTTNTSSVTPPATRFIFKYGKAKLSYSNGYSATYTDQEFTVTKNIHLFGYSGSNTSGNIAGKIYNVNHYEDGVLMHRYIPIRRKADKYVGVYETVNKAPFKFIAPPYSIAPYTPVTNSLSNCTAALTSDAYTGVTSSAVIGENWSCKYTPSSGYTFAGGTTPQVLIDGVDVTSQVVTDNGDGTYNVTIANVEDKPIEINAVAVEIVEVDYVQTDGVHAIQTNYIPTGTNIKILAKFEVLRYTSSASWGRLFGAYTGEANEVYRLARYLNSNSSFFAGCGCKASACVAVSGGLNTIYEMEMTYNSISLNGVVTNLNTTQGTTNSSKFAINAHNAILRIWYIQVYDGDDLKLDLIPVRLDTQACVKDNVSGEFFIRNEWNYQDKEQSNSLLTGSVNNEPMGGNTENNEEEM